MGAPDSKNETAREREVAKERGKEEAVVALTELVDDCDRALQALEHGADRQSLQEGLDQTLSRVLRRFEELGVIPFGAVGEHFDPVLHNAIATEAASYVDAGEISKVHRRGWMHKDDHSIVRTAMVTVCSEHGEAEDPASSRGRRHTPRPVGFDEERAWH